MPEASSVMHQARQLARDAMQQRHAVCHALMRCPAIRPDCQIVKLSNCHPAKSQFAIARLRLHWRSRASGLWVMLGHLGQLSWLQN